MDSFFEKHDLTGAAIKSPRIRVESSNATNRESKPLVARRACAKI